MTYEERQEKFLKELSDLTKKYRIEISGCGCCGSPSLSPLDSDIVRIYQPDAEDKFPSVTIERISYSYDGQLEFNKLD